MSGNAILMYVSGGMGSCVGLVVLLYNLVTAVLFLREETEGTSSGLAKASWALGLAALFTWFLPCVGGLLAIAAIVVARVERGRIYRDESSLAGATPVRMGSVDGGVALLLQLLMFVGMLAGIIAAWRT